MATLSGVVTPSVSPATARYLYNPFLDFLLLGGGSLLVLPVLALAFPAPERPAILVAVSLVIAHFVNHPHFAHSYQIFYKDFSSKLTNRDLSAGLRARYCISGIVVPMILIAYFAFAVSKGDLILLGLAANLMTLLVGWHYVKQGYGMLIVDSVLKRHYFGSRQKTILLVNAYVVWAYAWTRVNVAISEQDFWNLSYYSFALPEWLLAMTTALMALSTAAAIGVILTDVFSRSAPRPWNGIVAYFTTLYLWTAFVTLNPALLLLVPAFHSLQYLAVVWRFKVNAAINDETAKERPKRTLLGWQPPTVGTVRLINFALIGMLLGFLGFWWIPQKLDAWIGYDETLFGSTLFLFVFWLFINVHHYFLDSVMWRAENPEVRRNLFAPK
jgi:hypothetical protein